MFYSGALIAVLVSAAIFMQVLSTDLIRRLPSYATLRAMGFGAGFVHAVALLQSLLLGLLGFGPALLLALGANRLVAALTHLPAALTPATLALLAGLFTLSAALSLASALRRLRRVDPAELFA
ncbi:MAG TPA: FtsX-like permease family protein [Gammaproteobacteria bacterium]